MATIYKLIILIVGLGLSLQTQGKEFTVQVASYIGDGSITDRGFSLSWSHFVRDYQLVYGAEFRSIDWGNQAGIFVANRHRYGSRGSWTLGGYASAHLDLALFRGTSMIAPALSYQMYGRWQSGKRFYMELLSGFRYNICVGYEKYGPNKQGEIPLRLGIGWQL